MSFSWRMLQLYVQLLVHSSHITSLGHDNMYFPGMLLVYLVKTLFKQNNQCVDFSASCLKLVHSLFKVKTAEYSVYCDSHLYSVVD